MEIKKLLGKRIETLRKNKGLTQEELAFRANISRSYLANIECGRKWVGADTVSALAEALNVPVDELWKEG